MKGRDIGLLMLLGAMWGSSFLFIKVALSEVEPAFIVACRVLFGALALIAAAPFLGRISGKIEGGLARSVLRLWRRMLMLGIFNAALPFLVIAWGTQFLPSGTAAILNSTVPLFTAVLAGVLPFFADEKLGLLGVVGILLGIAGVSVLAGGFGEGLSASPAEALAGAGAIMTGSTSYAIGGLYARRAMKGVPVTVSAVGQSLGAFVVILPLAALSLPERMPDLPVIGSLVGLGVLGTGLSLLIYFRLISNVGATRTATVTYLVPLWALVYGAVLLGEQITGREILGLALILLGVAGVTGIMKLPRKRPPAAP